MESLHYGVPMGGVPQMPEQMMTALDSQTLTVERLHTTIKAAFSNADYRTNARAMQQPVHTASGYQHGADSILHCAQSQRQAPTQV
jgi:UDP:flavonoid glycosyltransferase YjiC (YdhE family)